MDRRLATVNPFFRPDNREGTFIGATGGVRARDARTVPRPVDGVDRSIVLVNRTDPDPVLNMLADTTFSLRGCPESNRQKLLLITVSRFIERAAWTASDGTIRSSFQRLSRLDDEVGTRDVYERVSATGVDTRLYGVPDGLSSDLDAVIHAGDGADFTDSWFVAQAPAERSAIRGAGEPGRPERSGPPRAFRVTPSVPGHPERSGSPRAFRVTPSVPGRSRRRRPAGYSRPGVSPRERRSGTPRNRTARPR